MLCKDCLYCKQWKEIDAAMCEKSLQAVDLDGRPCDDFVSRQMTDEWGELPTVMVKQRCN